MNSSPFELFRRNLKPLMVLLVGLAMFAFIVLPVLDQYLRKSGGGTDGDIVASFNGRDLTRGRVSYFHTESSVDGQIFGGVSSGDHQSGW